MLKPAEPEHKGIIERAHDYLERSFLPGRAFTGPGDFNTQLQAGWPLVNTRRRRALGCAPTDRIGADRQAMLALPPVAPATGWRSSTRLARDHYMRLDSNDYSVHPAVIGRRIEVVADLDRVKVFCDGKTVADHERVWAWHQTITDPTTSRPPRCCAATASVRCDRSAMPRPIAVEQRALADYDTALGIDPAARAGSRHDRGQAQPRPARDLTAEVAFLTRALKAPTLREAVPRLAERARTESWTHEEFLVACLQREVSARESHGGEGRIRAARFPARKSLEEFDFDHARGLKRDLIAHLGTLDFVAAQGERGLPRPTRHRQDPPGHRHRDPGLPSRPPGPVRHRLQWVARLADAHHAGRLQDELVRLGRYPLMVVDEVGYIPFEPEAANLFFQLVSSRYERASLIVTSNKPFGRWGEVFGDDVVAAAMIDRLVHHAEVVALKGDSYRLKDRDLGRVPASTTEEP